MTTPSALNIHNAFVLAFCFLPAVAQRDSLRQKINHDSLRIYAPRKVSFDFQFDNRHSFIRNRAITIEGFNPAIVVRQKFRWGLGLYRVIEPNLPFRSNKSSSVNTTNANTTRALDMYFVMPNFRYVFLRRKWMELSGEIAIGFGAIDYTIKDELSTKVLSTKNGLFIPAGLGLEVVFIPIRWVGIGGSFGYRKSLKTYDINGDFDGLYYSYGFKIFLGTIFRDMNFRARKKKLTREYSK